MLPAPINETLQSLLGTTIAAQTALSGGDISQVVRIDTADRRQWVVKYSRMALSADQFRKEALGLALLGASRTIGVARVKAHGLAPSGGWAYLLTEWIPPGYRNRLFWENFGTALANLHGNTSEQFGFSHDNYIGSLPQSNTRHTDWADFYAEERLWPQMLLARESELLESADENALERICRRLPMLCPDEPPALIHGDLWGGNVLCDHLGQPVLIDPAACFAHREMDLAMSRLFGGFDPVFYAAYHDNWPLEPDFEERQDVYQLYYLLVHLNLFGAQYLDAVRRVLGRF